MDSSSSCCSCSKTFVLIAGLLLIVATSGRSVVAGQQKKYESIISFGDSLADTGNKIHFTSSNAANLPYGMNFSGGTTGRFSNGRLVVDFIAQSMGLQFLQPYPAKKDSNFEGGVNFAVAGATALNATPSYLSLGTQLEWFQNMLPSLCNTTSGREVYFAKSLILMGEIGGNDYNGPFLDGKSKEEVENLVPDVVTTISSAIQKLISLGAHTLVVPGNLPIGCSAAYLTKFQSHNKTDYDSKTGCLNWLNTFAQHHNQLLQDELVRLRLRYPAVKIIYGDYFNAAMEFYSDPVKYGFGNAKIACCGGKGPYNYDASVPCGAKGSTVCRDPSTFVSWDGIHLTEAAYHLIANGIIAELLPQ